MILIASSIGLALAVALLIFMIVSELRDALISSIDKGIEEELLKQSRIVQQESWKPANGVLSTDDYVGVGLVLLEVDSMEVEDLENALIKRAKNASIAADNAILRAMRNQNANP